MEQITWGIKKEKNHEQNCKTNIPPASSLKERN